MSTKEVKLLRDRLELSQDELADYLGLAGKNVVSRWEIGERSPGETVHRLLKYLMDLPKIEAIGVLKRFRRYGEDIKVPKVKK